jgi:hypothetical protein
LEGGQLRRFKRAIARPSRPRARTGIKLTFGNEQKASCGTTAGALSKEARRGGEKRGAPISWLRLSACVLEDIAVAVLAKSGANYPRFVRVLAARGGRVNRHNNSPQRRNLVWLDSETRLFKHRAMTKRAGNVAEDLGFEFLTAEARVLVFGDDLTKEVAARLSRFSNVE